MRYVCEVRPITGLFRALCLLVAGAVVWGCAAKVNQPDTSLGTITTTTSTSSSSSGTTTGTETTASLSIVPATVSVDASSGFAFGATGGVPPYTFSLLSGGGTVSASSGRYVAPTSAGPGVLRVTDAVGAHADAAITVEPALAISSSFVSVAESGVTTFSATGGDGNYTYFVEAGGGTITQTGTYTAPASAGVAIVEVSDGTGATSQSVVTITGGGGGSISTVTFTAATGSADESAGTVYAYLNFSPALTQSVSIGYSIGGTAVGAGTNYSLTLGGTTLSATGTLNIPAETTQEAFAIGLVNHSLATPSVPSATVQINLTSFTNVDAGATIQFTQTIVNSDILPAASFAAATASGLINAGTVNIPVTIDRTWPQTVSMTYSVTGGSATGGGVDYTLAPGTLTFAPGVTSQNIALQLTDVSTVSPPKTIVITLAGFTQSAAGAYPALTFTINNNNSNDLYLSGSGGSTLNGVAITTCGGGGACSSASPYVVSSNTIFSSITLVNNAVLSGAAWASGPEAPGNGQLVMTVTGNVSIAAGSSISMDGKGYAGNTGPGVGSGTGGWGAGSGYGGQGGMVSGVSASSTYGSLMNPVDIGSGGGVGGCCWGGGGSGGGAIIMSVYGTLLLNGAITANGATGPGQSGGGSGGAINLTTAVVQGSTGVLSVAGGNAPSPSAGGGGGGRIAVNYTTDGYTGGVPAIGYVLYGGSNAYQNGGSGTAFLNQQSVSIYGSLIVDNHSYAGAAMTPILSNQSIDTLTLRNSANLEVASGQTLTYTTPSFSGNSTITNYGTIGTALGTIANITLLDFGTITIPGGNLTIANGGTLSWGTGTLSLNSLDIQSGGVLTHPANWNLSTYMLTLNVTGTATVEAGGSIDLDAKGFGQGFGPGAGVGCSGGPGGSYGGPGGPSGGGCTGGPANGSLSDPTVLGSGGVAWNGAGGNGGGSLMMTASTLSLSGSITAQGGAGTGNSGGGSGGTINITATTVSGAAGLISVNGGASGGNGSGGDGGGGRIAVTYTTDSYTGGFSSITQTAYTGTGPDLGAAGTIFSDHVGVDTNGHLIVNANGVAGVLATPVISNTLLDGFSITPGTNLQIDAGVSLQSSSTNIQAGGILTNYGTYLNSTSAITGMTLYNYGTLTIPGNNLTIGANGTFVASAPLNLSSLWIQDGGVLSHAANGSTQNYTLQVTTTTLTLDSGGLIDVDGMGFSPGNGPGAGISNTGCSGAGYGGRGGPSAGGSVSNGYGSVTDPVNLGSGGCDWSGTGGAGGGAALLTVSGTFTLNGIISSNGLAGTGNSGGGSGGTVNISAGTIAGSTGQLSVNGGTAGTSGSGGAGGGGRIAMVYTTDSFSGGVSSIPMTAYGGTMGPAPGGAGTIYLMHTGVDTNGRLIIADNNESGCESTPLAGTEVFDSITVTGAANLEVAAGASLSSTSTTFEPGTALTNNGSYNNPVSTFSGMTVTNNGTLNIPSGNLTITSGTFIVENNNLSLNNLEIGAGAVLTHPANGGTQVNTLNLSVSGNLTIDAGGQINIDGKGFTSATGPGAGISDDGCSGAGYGGRGGGNGTTVGGTFYGSLTSPVDLGSGGCNWSGTGGPGGGLARVTVGGTFTFNGIISANGVTGNGNSGGGSGGGVYVSAGTIAGSGGVIRAGGGDAQGANSGAGAGGRVALYYTTDSYTGGIGGISMNAYGGVGGAQPGAAGTVFVFQNGTSTIGNLTVDNGGAVGPTTPLAGSYSFDSVTLANAAQLEVRPGLTYAPAAESNGAGTGILNYGTYVASSSNLAGYTVTNYGALQFPSGALTLASGGTLVDGSNNLALTNLSIGSGGNLTHVANSTLQTYYLNLTVLNLTIESGGTIDLDGKGFAAQTGTGAGGYDATAGAGGGYGGQGGASENVATGGATYGNMASPAAIGSGGGDSNCGVDGGAGGGYALINVTGTFTLYGTISANGSPGICRGGGGSGGTINITAYNLSPNTGIIEANGGGIADGRAGPGGGGRVWLSYSEGSITGMTLEANGALGGTYGNGANGSVIPP